MSIPATRVVQHIRLQIDDFDEAKVSDFQILTFMNRALTAISAAIAAKDLDFLSASKAYNTSSASDGAALPDDFQSVKEVTDGEGFTLNPVYLTKTPQAYEYKIVGEKIYCGASSYTLFYKKFIEPIDSLENGVIGMPAYCLGMIVQITVLLMQNADPATVIQTINNIIETDIPLQTYDKKRVSGRVVNNAG